MLAALSADLMQTGHYRVCTTLDERVWLDAPADLAVRRVSSAAEEWLAFQELARQSAATVVIAPELGRVLADRISWLESNRLNRVLSDVVATSLTADKFRFAEWAAAHGIPTPVTQSVCLNNLGAIDWSKPRAFKPRYGAGSTATARIENAVAGKRFLGAEEHQEFAPFIVQPWHEGTPVSLAGIVCPKSGKRVWGPLGRQDFRDGHYDGGTIPFVCPVADDAVRIAEQVCDLLPGLRGWIGFDFLYSTEASPPLQLLEVNPRMTTSYLGYRKLTDSSLAELMLGDGSSESIFWGDKVIEFTAAS